MLKTRFLSIVLINMFQISGLFKFWYSFFIFSKWSTGTYNPGTFNRITGINSSPAKKICL